MDLRSTYKQTDLGLIPEEWDIIRLGDVTIKVGSGITPTGGEKVYKKEGRPFMRSQNVGWGQLLLDDIAYIDDKTHSSFSETEIKLHDVLLNITGASIGRSALADWRLVGGNVNQHVCIIRTDTNKLLPHYLNLFMLSERGQNQINSFQAGGNRQGLNFQQIRSFQLLLPPRYEQHYIATTIGEVDDLITSLNKLIIKMRLIKQSVMQELLTGKKRLPMYNGKWSTIQLKDILKYERPDNYFVQDTEYSERGDIPVLTANKSFILGYTHEDFGICRDIPVIVFDDFTTDSKFAGFPFKVKSSAIKLLRSKNERVDIRYIFNRMQLIQFSIGDHKRYYISEYQNIQLEIPDRDEQTAITAILSDMDSEIYALEKRRDKTILLKQGMMQELLTGRIRLI